MGYRNKWLVLIAAVFGLFRAILDAPIVTIAVSTIERALKTGIETVTRVLNSYNIVFAVLLIPAGRSTLDRLSRQLQAIFARAAAGSFDRAFLVAAIILWAGAIPAYLVGRAAGMSTPPARFAR